MNYEDLINMAWSAMQKAYAPYSGFRVGAALLLGSGNVYTGCNIENASYGLTVCAERVAVFKAISDGHRDFKALAVICDSIDYCSPCGACRQVLAEFSHDMPVIMANNKKTYEVRRVRDLIPLQFNKEHMNRRNNNG